MELTNLSKISAVSIKDGKWESKKITMLLAQLVDKIFVVLWVLLAVLVGFQKGHDGAMISGLRYLEGSQGAQGEILQVVFFVPVEILATGQQQFNLPKVTTTARNDEDGHPRAVGNGQAASGVFQQDAKNSVVAVVDREVQGSAAFAVLHVNVYFRHGQ